MATTTALQKLISDFIETQKLDKTFEDTALNWFKPLTEKLVMHHNSAEGPLFIGLNGCQGSGKSTLTAFLVASLKDVFNLDAHCMSLDDFYLTKSQRLALSIKIHPLLATRGVPGTHDTELLSNVIQAIKNEQFPVKVPSFNKAIDDRAPESEWHVIDKKVDIILLEGWCWGVPPESAESLTLPVNDLEKNNDPNGVWRRFVNRCLFNDYLPLYEYMDLWVMLKAPSFSCVYDWRLQQETKLIASLEQAGELKDADNSGIMQPHEIATFIQHYQRLTEHSLETLGEKADICLHLNKHRKITQAKGLS